MFSIIPLLPLLFVQNAFACFSTAGNRKTQSECSADNENWVPNMAQLPIGTKKVACEIMMLMDLNLLPTEFCQQIKRLYKRISDLDKQLLHIMWWDEIDCTNINETEVDPFYPLS